MPKILLVEDDPKNYDMLKRRLEGRGYEVQLATDGEAAVAQAADPSLDLILMDIKLPEMDGLEATRRIREAEGDEKRVPIIALTAHAFTEDETKAEAAGCDDYHAKPVFFTELVKQIERLLKKAQEQEA
jgi:CheY-like chemotaxis protein